MGFLDLNRIWFRHSSDIYQMYFYLGWFSSKSQFFHLQNVDDNILLKAICNVYEPFRTMIGA